MAPDYAMKSPKVLLVPQSGNALTFIISLRSPFFAHPSSWFTKKKESRACPFTDQSLSIDRSINARKFFLIKEGAFCSDDLSKSIETFSCLSIKVIPCISLNNNNFHTCRRKLPKAVVHKAHYQSFFFKLSNNERCKHIKIIKKFPIFNFLIYIYKIVFRLTRFARAIQLYIYE